jgi:hypothetical protein
MKEPVHLPASNIYAIEEVRGTPGLCIEVRLVPERRREGLEGLPRAGRAVVIISGMCKKGALDQRREDSGCA